jgi:hypothetical protein
MHCACDLLSSLLLVLGRFEELQSQRITDSHGRFPATASLAYQQGYLERPIVDEWGMAFGRALIKLMPKWKPLDRKLRVKLSHDIDTVGIPFYWKSTLEHTTRRYDPISTLRDVLALMTDVEPTFLRRVIDIAQKSIDHGVNSAVYWKASPSSESASDSGYDPRHPKIKRVMEWLRKNGVEQGIHPGYLTFNAVDELALELQILQQAIGEKKMGGRQHFLRWAPQTWEHWERCGLAYDSTVGFADHVGFRAGTCHPYRPWLLWKDREADLLEIPLIVMDGTLVDYMKLSPEKSYEAISRMLDECRKVGGVFTLLWHNSTLTNPSYGDTYDKVLELVRGAQHFDWESAVRLVAA